jgi:hypothetical protein
MDSKGFLNIVVKSAYVQVVLPASVADDAPKVYNRGTVVL